LIAAYGKKATAIVTFEDHVLMGGFGSAMLEALNEMQIDVPVVRHRLAGPLHRARKGRATASALRHQRRSCSREARSVFEEKPGAAHSGALNSVIFGITEFVIKKKGSAPVSIRSCCLSLLP